MTPIQLSPFASMVLASFYILAATLLVALLVAVAFALYKLNAMLEEYRTKIDPLLAKADSLLEITTSRVDSLGGKAERILAQGEQITDNVHDRVERTASTVQKTVNAPIIGVNSLAAGLGRGLATFAHLQQRKSRRPAQIPVITKIEPPIARGITPPTSEPAERIIENERIPVAVGLPNKEYRNGGQ